MQTYSLEQLLGFSAYAGKSAGKHTNTFAEPYKVAKKGDFLGIIYSYVVRDSVIWLMLEGHGDNVNTCFVKFTDIDTTKLKSAGVKSDAQLAREKSQSNMPWYERLISKYGAYLMIGLGVIAILPVLFNRSKK